MNLKPNGNGYSAFACVSRKLQTGGGRGLRYQSRDFEHEFACLNEAIGVGPYVKFFSHVEAQRCAARGDTIACPALTGGRKSYERRFSLQKDATKKEGRTLTQGLRRSSVRISFSVEGRTHVVIGGEDVVTKPRSKICLEHAEEVMPCSADPLFTEKDWSDVIEPNTSITPGSVPPGPVPHAVGELDLDEVAAHGHKLGWRRRRTPVVNREVVHGLFEHGNAWNG
ncbi:hypothetical protein OF83DRAFT_1085965 [Amylostereum chailletii]|nr:hypothetical protein OF83DRAFT_1085965 [Amylostereum chailletii]